MACATLKRSLDWESLNQRPTKRRRCLPFGTQTSPSTSSSSSTARVMEPTPSPFAEASAFTPKLTPGECREVALLISIGFQLFFVEKMAENIREEIRRLHRRKQLSFGQTQTVEQMQDSESSGSEMGAESPRRPDTPPAAVKNPEMALFTFKQVRWGIHEVWWFFNSSSTSRCK
jgi:hypothetical protein